MKGKKIFGIPIALFVIGILLIGGVSAGLLTYFSPKSNSAEFRCFGVMP